jgi:hypothetical protein
MLLLAGRACVLLRHKPLLKLLAVLQRGSVLGDWHVARLFPCTRAPHVSSSGDLWNLGVETSPSYAAQADDILHAWRRRQWQPVRV